MNRSYHNFFRALIPLFLLFLVGTENLNAQIPDAPKPPRMFNDLAGIISPEKAQQTERKLREFRDSTSVEIAVVIVESLNGYDPSQFAFELGDKWGVGDADFENGIVLLVKPKFSQNDKGEVFIATGYGLEGAIPDATSQLIISNELIPRFKRNDYIGGIDAALNTIMELAREEYSPEEYAQTAESNKGGYGILVPLMFIFLFIVMAVLAKINRARHYAVGRDIPFWTALMMAGMMNSRHTGAYSSFRSGSGSFGGGFGGGGSSFGGFGGGSFGGGGAGGSW